MLLTHPTITSLYAVACHVAAAHHVGSHEPPPQSAPEAHDAHGLQLIGLYVWHDMFVVHEPPVHAHVHVNLFGLSVTELGVPVAQRFVEGAVAVTVFCILPHVPPVPISASHDTDHVVAQRQSQMYLLLPDNANPVLVHPAHNHAVIIDPVSTNTHPSAHPHVTPVPISAWHDTAHVVAPTQSQIYVVVQDNVNPVFDPAAHSHAAIIAPVFANDHPSAHPHPIQLVASHFPLTVFKEYPASHPAHAIALKMSAATHWSVA
jgi:hypothetical protein